MKTILIPALAGCLLAAAKPQAAPSAGTRAAKPNIVLILADDMGFSDIGSFGGEIQTPVLDSLAGKGVRFTQFYNTARCCPTRASLMTGLYPHQAGQGWMNADQSAAYGPGYAGGLNRRCVTMAEALGPAGYRTLMVGKWHIVTATAIAGADKSGWPLQRGFERYYGLIHGAGNYYTGLNPDGHAMVSGNQAAPVPPGFYMTDNLGDTAVKFLSDHFAAAPARPFFLYAAFTAPHWPLHALKADIDKYRTRYAAGWEALRAERHARQKQLGIVSSAWPLTPEDAPAWSGLAPAMRDTMALKMAIYAAQVDRLDRNVGKIVAELKRNGALENTLIVFLSDNGACAEGGNLGYGPHRQIETREGYNLSYGQGWAHAGNTPFALYKHYTREGGIATPFIAHWPAAIPAGGMNGQPAHLIDLMPTFLELAGARYPASWKGWLIPPAEGRSLVKAFSGGPIGRTAPLFWEHEGNKAVRDGDWKLVANDGGKWRLIDMAADRTEMADLAGAQPARVAAMDSAWQAWARRAWVLKRPGTVPTRLALTAPVAEERIPAGSAYTIAWGATTDSVQRVRLRFQVDGGPWAAVADSVPHTGSLTWIVPTAPAARARLSIASLNGKWADTTGFFSLVPPTGIKPSPAAKLPPSPAFRGRDARGRSLGGPRP